jgi:hypothetical protein
VKLRRVLEEEFSQPRRFEKHHTPRNEGFWHYCVWRFGFCYHSSYPKITQTFKIYVILLLISGITHITSETAGLTVLLSTPRKSMRCVLTSSEYSRQSDRRVAGEHVAGKSEGLITYARIQASNSRHCPVRGIDSHQDSFPCFPPFSRRLTSIFKTLWLFMNLHFKALNHIGLLSGTPTCPKTSLRTLLDKKTPTGREVNVRFIYNRIMERPQ